MDVVRGRIYTVGNDGQVRVYDGAIDLGNDKYLGIEVKSGGASPTAPQREFDAWVNAGNTANGTGQSSGMDIIGTFPVMVGK
jgi:hypothetical protein